MTEARKKREAERIASCLAQLPGWEFDEQRSVFFALSRRSLGRTTVPVGNGLALTLEPAAEARVELGLRAGAREWTAARLQGLYALDRWFRKSRHDGEETPPRGSEGPGAKPKRPAGRRRKKPRRGEP